MSSWHLQGVITYFREHSFCFNLFDFPWNSILQERLYSWNRNATHMNSISARFNFFIEGKLKKGHTSLSSWKVNKSCSSSADIKFPCDKPCISSKIRALTHYTQLIIKSNRKTCFLWIHMLLLYYFSKPFFRHLVLVYLQNFLEQVKYEKENTLRIFYIKPSLLWSQHLKIYKHGFSSSPFLQSSLQPAKFTELENKDRSKFYW